MEFEHRISTSRIFSTTVIISPVVSYLGSNRDTLRACATTFSDANRLVKSHRLAKNSRNLSHIREYFMDE
jgi:hypothetical protein